MLKDKQIQVILFCVIISIHGIYKGWLDNSV